jgi:serine/threonine-protein kinase
VHVLLERRIFGVDDLEQWTASLQGAACHAWLVPDDVLPTWSSARTYHYHDGREMLVQHPIVGVDLLTLLGALEYERTGQLDRHQGYVAPSSPLPAVTAAALVLEVARALPPHPYRNRSLSPLGILFGLDGQVVVVAPELTDIAKSMFTSVVGNPTQRLKVHMRYGSREAARGVPTTPASDAFSLAVMLYEFVTGQHPFADAGATDFSFLEAVGTRRVAPPSSIFPSLSPAVDELLMRALGPDPTRFAEPANFTQSLLRAIEVPWGSRQELQGFVARLTPYMPAALQRWRSTFCFEPASFDPVHADPNRG